MREIFPQKREENCGENRSVQGYVRIFDKIIFLFMGKIHLLPPQSGMRNAVKDTMNMLESYNSNYYLAKKQLDGVILKQKALTSNLANVETPNYKRIDLDPNFDIQLSQAIQQNNIQNLDYIQPELVEDKAASNIRSDGNNVELDKEFLRMNENVLRHKLILKTLGDSLTQVKSAITGNS